MGIAGVIIGVLGIIIGFFGGLLFGWVGGGIAIGLGAIGILFGFLARKKTEGQKGTGAIIVGALAVLLSFFLTNSSVNTLKDALKKAKDNTDVAPTITEFADKINPSLGLVGGLVNIKDATEDEIKKITDELLLVIDDAKVKEKREELQKKVEETKEDIQEKVEGAGEAIGDAAEDAGQAVSDAVEGVQNAVTNP